MACYSWLKVSSYVRSHMTGNPSSLFIIPPPAEDQPIMAQVEQAMQQGKDILEQLPVLTHVAMGDPALAEQLRSLRQSWELRPEPPRGLLDRIRTRIAWWLLGPELRQASQVNATTLRLIDSLIVLVDHERSERRKMLD